MAIFSISFSYTHDQVVFHKTAIVRASSPELAKNKLIDKMTSFNDGKSFESFAFEKISVSSYNYVFI